MYMSDSVPTCSEKMVHQYSRYGPEVLATNTPFAGLFTQWGGKAGVMDQPVRDQAKLAQMKGRALYNIRQQQYTLHAFMPWAKGAAHMS